MPTEKIDLRLLVRYATDTTELNAWKAAFTRASELLYHATAGQMQFGTLDVVPNAAATEQGKIFLLNDPCDSFGAFKQHIELNKPAKENPLLIIHEFGHFEFDLGEEYPLKLLPNGKCIGNLNEQACIMEFAYKGDQLLSTGFELGKINEFCSPDSPGKHDKTNINQQNHHNNYQSCWETITRQDIRPDFTIPDSKRPLGEAAPEGHEPVDWIVVDSESSYSIVLDQSPTAANQAFKTGQHNGIRFWVDYYGMSNDYFSVISTDGSVLIPLQKIESEDAIQGIFQKLGALTFSSKPNIPGALNQLIKTIRPGTKQIAVQSATLLTTGDPDESLPDQESVEKVRQSRTQVHVVDVGPQAYRDPLHQLAEQSQGRIKAIFGPHQLNSTGFSVQSTITELAMAVRNGNGMVASISGTLPENRNLEIDYDLYSKIPDLISLQLHPGGVDLPVLIEETSQYASFALTAGKPDSLKLVVVDPDGKELDGKELDGKELDGKELDAKNALRFVERANYSFCIIETPKPGLWTLRAMREKNGDEIDVQAWGFSQNPDLFTRLLIEQSESRKIDFSATAYFNGPIFNYESPLITVEPVTQRKRNTQMSEQLQLILQPRGRYDEESDRTVVMNQAHYVGSLTVPRPGVYSITARFLNAGTAIQMGSVFGNPKPEAPVPSFIRTVHRQFRVK